jgi:hypothetical protein
MKPVSAMEVMREMIQDGKQRHEDLFQMAMGTRDYPHALFICRCPVGSPGDGASRMAGFDIPRAFCHRTGPR